MARRIARGCRRGSGGRGWSPRSSERVQDRRDGGRVREGRADREPAAASNAHAKVNLEGVCHEDKAVRPVPELRGATDGGARLRTWWTACCRRRRCGSKCSRSRTSCRASRPRDRTCFARCPRLFWEALRRRCQRRQNARAVGLAAGRRAGAPCVARVVVDRDARGRVRVRSRCRMHGRPRRTRGKTGDRQARVRA
jgi:hypothetical protein